MRKRKVWVRTPGGKTKLMLKKRKPDKHICGSCGKELHGIPRLIQSKFKNLPKTMKRPQRPYGGVLCSACMRKTILEKVRREESKSK